MNTPISVVILTQNEQANLSACLSSLAWADDIHVVDSGSSDNTVSIAQSAGAETYEHRFEGFGSQRNWALKNCALKNDWVLFLDADEHSTDAFCIALHDAVSSAPDNCAGFYCCWKQMLDSTWLKRCDSFPKWQVRVVHRGRAEYEDFGHGQKAKALSGEFSYLREPYLHYAFSKGWVAWWEKHARYAKQEAELRSQTRVSLTELLLLKGAERRKAARFFVSRLPGWPIARFLIPYVFRLGFLEGAAGFTYCKQMARFERLVQLEMIKLATP